MVILNIVLASNNLFTAALGQMLLCGHGCTINKTVGVKWLKESSTRGCMYATGLLSCEYFNSKLYSRAVENALKYVL